MSIVLIIIGLNFNSVERVTAVTTISFSSATDSLKIKSISVSFKITIRSTRFLYPLKLISKRYEPDFIFSNSYFPALSVVAPVFKSLI